MSKKTKPEVVGKKYLWLVEIPITGVCYTEVIASTEEEAIDKAMEKNLEIEHWQQHTQIVEGNVFHGETNKASAEIDHEVEEGEDK